MQGKFITFEGGEGTGKSTHAAMLARHLESLGLGVLLTREPGGSPGAEVIRHVLLSGAAKPFGPEAEAMLFAAARDDHLNCSILPALSAGKWVVCDRFVDSTRVYQGVLGKLDRRLIKALERVSIGTAQPRSDFRARCAGRVGAGAGGKATRRRQSRSFRGGENRVSRDSAPGLSDAGRIRAGALRDRGRKRHEGRRRQTHLGDGEFASRPGHGAVRL